MPDAFADWVFKNHQGGIPSSVHHVGDMLITIEGAVAHSESYVLASHRKLIDGARRDLPAHGRYVDRFEERGGQWKVADRIVIVDWERVDRVEPREGRPLTEQSTKGTRDPHDVSCTALPTVELVRRLV